MSNDFVDYINDSIRILIIAETLKDKKSHMLTDSRIKLYDYYLKFPETMLQDEGSEILLKKNFDEVYSFFHWQPDIIRYRRSINYLLAKELLERHNDNNSLHYTITPKGIDALNRIKNEHKSKLQSIANFILIKKHKLSETKITEEIELKSKKHFASLREVEI